MGPIAGPKSQNRAAQAQHGQMYRGQCLVHPKKQQGVDPGPGTPRSCEMGPIRAPKSQNTLHKHSMDGCITGCPVHPKKQQGIDPGPGTSRSCKMGPIGPPKSQKRAAQVQHGCIHTSTHHPGCIHRSHVTYQWTCPYVAPWMHLPWVDASKAMV